MPVKSIKHALVTGPGPFGKYKVNRAWETVKLLDGEAIMVGDTTVVVHCHRVPVSYDELADVIPCLHQIEDFSIVIHCGIAEEHFVRLEKQAHKSGYFWPGDKGPTDVPPNGCVQGYDLPEILTTDIDVKKLWKSLFEGGWTSTRVSVDAGVLQCNFQYYISLAEGKVSYPARNLPAPKTLFVHIPTIENEPYNDVQTSYLLRDIIKHLA
ncbi:Pyroglutamyl-peptidase 1 [Coemansia guatemalensis]|uniref:Pyroglutamyl-peptidase 1 n=1 Tax=Coemansia guatemalensis TaxID=2761395 RepID=A0A9W8HWV2_9FUNG|nr:Pyroglutamyl-peptidase 1 [Coemansia guatemalensis]